MEQCVKKFTIKTSSKHLTDKKVDTLDGIKTIVAVLETGSFTAAGDRLGLSKALISKYISLMEQQYGVRFFNRTTRKIAPTEAGLKYYEKAQIILNEFASLVDFVSEKKDSLKGSLKISTSVTFGEFLLIDKIPEFMRTHPELHLDINLSNHKIDLLEEGVDVALRISDRISPNLIARKITEFPFCLCASPTYLKAYGTPQSTAELQDHKCIVDSNFRITNEWPFQTADALDRTIAVPSAISVNSPRAIRDLAINGVGIALLPKFVVYKDIEAGILTEILENQSTLSFSLHALIPHREYIPNKVRYFIEFLSEQFKPHSLCADEKTRLLG
ncbi:transcriptional regulator, LysR family [Teredinibacter turnerae T7901]|uniref:Transcriptional regulator, LysR family n=1 Tax=Teredinibacter turnerae (strain ATCC 39867 / T7901) TaxID=377629 RepID=C5BT57_TERTT|nr:LysR family transcriptional regulator [Teredinibacter turnerae]ACR12469.1 transcriptional regulator, LysR family [Teredinibacter turnerae T7901]